MAVNYNDQQTNVAASNLTNSGTTEWTTNFPFVNSTEAMACVATSQQFCTITDNSNMKQTGNFTIEAWVKLDSTGTSTIFQSYSQNTNRAGIVLDYSGTFFRLFTGKNTGTTQGTDWQIATGATAVTDTTTWHHVAGTWDGSNLRVILDGVEDASVAWANAPAYAATNYVRVGERTNDGTYANSWDGKLDEVRFWNIYRSAATINSEKGDEVSPSATGLVGYWPFETVLGGSASASASASSSISPSASLSPSASQSPSASLSSSASASRSISPSFAENTLSIDLYEVCFPIVYAGKYSTQSNTYTSKYSSQGTSYTSKYSTQANTYVDKYGKVCVGDD